MKRSQVSMLAVPAASALAILFALASPQAVTRDDDDHDKDIHFISQSAMLKGLAAGAVFPFIDVTPHGIRRAHIAVTDATDNCAGPGSGAPSNVQVLVGEAGVALVPVLSEATNTGISTTPGQCVFHVTIRAGADGVPGKVTDIVVLNAGGRPLSGVNTITASAEVVRRKGGGGGHHH